MTAAQPTKRYRRKETLADLSDDMQTLLIHCASRGVHPKEIGDEGRWSLTTRKTLEQHGLIHLGKNAKGKDLWRATDEGRGVVAAHAPRLLMPAARPRRIGEEGHPSVLGYTDIPAFGMRHEPESLGDAA